MISLVAFEVSYTLNQEFSLKSIIDSIYNNKFEKYKNIIKQSDQELNLTIVTVGDDPASAVYVRNKIALMEKAGVRCSHLYMKRASQEELDLIAKETDNPIIFQLPLPDGLVAPDLPLCVDVDGFGLEAMSHILNDSSWLLPCTVEAVFDIIKHTFHSIVGMKVAVIGRSKIVGKPLVVELINRGATVTSFNSSSNLGSVDWSGFDIIVSATGCHGILRSSQIKEHQLVIDVGISRKDGRLVGDIEHDVIDHSCNITPVPGGVGRLTVMNVLGNAIKLAGINKKK